MISQDQPSVSPALGQSWFVCPLIVGAGTAPGDGESGATGPAGSAVADALRELGLIAAVTDGERLGLPGATAIRLAVSDAGQALIADAEGNVTAGADVVTVCADLAARLAAGVVIDHAGVTLAGARIPLPGDRQAEPQARGGEQPSVPRPAVTETVACWAPTYGGTAAVAAALPGAFPVPVLAAVGPDRAFAVIAPAFQPGEVPDLGRGTYPSGVVTRVGDIYSIGWRSGPQAKDVIWTRFLPASVPVTVTTLRYSPAAMAAKYLTTVVFDRDLRFSGRSLNIAHIGRLMNLEIATAEMASAKAAAKAAKVLGMPAGIIDVLGATPSQQRDAIQALAEATAVVRIAPQEPGPAPCGAAEPASAADQKGKQGKKSSKKYAKKAGKKAAKDGADASLAGSAPPGRRPDDGEEGPLDATSVTGRNDDAPAAGHPQQATAQPAAPGKDQPGKALASKGGKRGIASRLAERTGQRKKKH